VAEATTLHAAGIFCHIVQNVGGKNYGDIFGDCNFLIKKVVDAF